MSAKSKLYQNTKSFIDNNCSFQKNEPFIINYISPSQSDSQLPKVQDETNFIYCINNIPKEKSNLIEDAKEPKGKKINVKDSCFEFVLYKTVTTTPSIKCLILLIINDIEACDGGDEIKAEKKISDINCEYQLLEQLKKFISKYIKKNKGKKNKNVESDDSNNILQNILLAGAENDIRFFNHDNNGIKNYGEENIKKIIEIIKKMPSKLEIKQKKNENEKSGNKENEEKDDNKNKKKEIDKEINDVLDELNPDYKNELIYRYLDEMPEEIVNLMKKYRKIDFTKNMYLEYINKEKNINIEEKQNDEQIIEQNNENLEQERFEEEEN